MSIRLFKVKKDEGYRLADANGVITLRTYITSDYPSWSSQRHKVELVEEVPDSLKQDDVLGDVRNLGKQEVTAAAETEKTIENLAELEKANILEELKKFTGEDHDKSLDTEVLRERLAEVVENAPEKTPEVLEREKLLDELKERGVDVDPNLPLPMLRLALTQAK